MDLHLQYLPQDLAKWKSLFAEDAILEFPYGPSASLPARLVGSSAMAEFAATLVHNVIDLRFTPARLYACADPDETFAEYECQGQVRANGRPYQQKYLSFLRAESNQIVFMKEYFDPVRVIQAFY